MLLVNSWVVVILSVACKANVYVCICTYDGIKVGLLYNNAGYVL